jgi:hypothetical protein
MADLQGAMNRDTDLTPIVAKHSDQVQASGIIRERLNYI